MTKTMTITELKNLMALSGWTHEQDIDEDFNEVEGIAEVVSYHPDVPFEIHFNERFKYNVETDELTTRRDDSLYGVWWFTPELEIIDNNGETIDSWDLDQQGFKSEFSTVDYSKLIENAKENAKENEE